MTRKLASRGHAALGDPLPARAPTIASISPLAPQVASSAEGGTATSTLVAVDGVDLVVWSAGAGGPRARNPSTRRRQRYSSPPRSARRGCAASCWCPRAWRGTTKPPGEAPRNPWSAIFHAALQRPSGQKHPSNKVKPRRQSPRKEDDPDGNSEGWHQRYPIQQGGNPVAGNMT